MGTSSREKSGVKIKHRRHITAPFGKTEGAVLFVRYVNYYILLSLFCQNSTVVVILVSPKLYSLR